MLNFIFINIKTCRTPDIYDHDWIKDLPHITIHPVQDFDNIDENPSQLRLIYSSNDRVVEKRSVKYKKTKNRDAFISEEYNVKDSKVNACMKCFLVKIYNITSGRFYTCPVHAQNFHTKNIIYSSSGFICDKNK